MVAGSISCPVPGCPTLSQCCPSAVSRQPCQAFHSPAVNGTFFFLSLGFWQRVNYSKRNRKKKTSKLLRHQRACQPVYPHVWHLCLFAFASLSRSLTLPLSRSRSRTLFRCAAFYAKTGISCVRRRRCQALSCWPHKARSKRTAHNKTKAGARKLLSVRASQKLWKKKLAINSNLQPEGII